MSFVALTPKEHFLLSVDDISRQQVSQRQTTASGCVRGPGAGWERMSGEILQFGQMSCRFYLHCLMA